MSSFPELPADQLTSFFRAIEENPDSHDVVPSLVLADWLEDHGDPRAELVRVQSLQRTHLVRGPDWWDLHDREVAWLERYQDQWLGLIPGGLPLQWNAGRFLIELDAGWFQKDLPPGLEQALEQGWSRGRALRYLMTSNCVSFSTRKQRRNRIVSLSLAGRCTVKSLRLLERLPCLQELSLDDLPVSDKDLQELAGLSGLRALEFHPVSTRGLSCLKGMTGLRRLTLTGLRRASGKALTVLERLAALEELDLGLTGLVLTGLEPLQGCPRLRRLVLDDGVNNNSDLSALAGLPALEDLSLQYIQLDARLWRQVGQLTRLRRLDLSVTDLNARSVAHLAGLASLEVLHLASSTLTDAGIKHLQGLTGLLHLQLDDTNISAKGLEVLLRLPRLCCLGLAEMRRVDWAFLSRLSTLRQLDLSGTDVSDQTLKQLAGLSGLRELRLSNSEVHGRGLASLTNLKLLEVLDLSATGLHGKGLEALAELTGLRELNLADGWGNSACLPHLVRLTRSAPARSEQHSGHS